MNYSKSVKVINIFDDIHILLCMLQWKKGSILMLPTQGKLNDV